MPAPLTPIPPVWAERGHCPVCAATPLQAAPDHLTCPACGAAFEVEQGGSRLHLTHLPAGLHANPDEAWRTAAEVHAWVRGLAQRPGPLASPPAPADPCPAEALARAQQLYALRHTSAQIQAILENAQTWTPEQVRAVVAVIQAQEARIRARQNQGLRLTLAGLLGVTVILTALAVAASLQPRTAPTASPPAPAVQAGGAGQPLNPTPDLPAGLLTLVPPGARLENPTPVVRRGATPVPGAGGAVSPCPRTSAEAAQLFGGAADLWRADDTGRGWILVSPTGPVTVQVPARMTAGYLKVGQSLEVVSVAGPAVIEQIYMAAITCE